MCITLRIGLLTAPIQKSGIAPLSNLFDILSDLSDPTVITGNCARLLFTNATCHSNSPIYFINYRYRSNAILKILFNIYLQLPYTYYLFKSSKNVDFWIFFLGGGRMVLPMLTARLLKKPVIFCIPGNDSLAAKISKSVLVKPIVVLSEISYKISNRIILYSPNLIREWNLEKYRSKIIIAHRHFLDFKIFTLTTPLPERPRFIGYIGRLSAEKGLHNFIEAIPSIIRDQPNLHIFIIGDGPLREEIKVTLEEKGLTNHVDLLGWIPHEDLPICLNKLQLLVIPSYVFEGLPNIMLEAMACGTPVLATPVGAITDVIGDGKTGFIMENNSPECIEKNVLRALDYPNLEGIAENGKHFVQEGFRFEKVVKNWERILQNIQ